MLLPFFFVSPLAHLQNVSLGGLFSSEETKKELLGRDWVSREGGAWGHDVFGQTAKYSAWCGQVCL